MTMRAVSVIESDWQAALTAGINAKSLGAKDAALVTMEKLQIEACFLPQHDDGIGLVGKRTKARQIALELERLEAVAKAGGSNPMLYTRLEELADEYAVREAQIRRLESEQE
jgi:hypothetical protein